LIFDLDAQKPENLDVATIEFLGDFDRPVKIDATTFGAPSNAPDDSAFYQAFLPNLRYDRAADRFVSTGGGTLRATFRTTDPEFKLPALVPNASATPNASGAPNASDNSEIWTTVCLKFQNEIAGDVARRELAAVGGVRAVACQASRPLFELDVDVPATQPQDSVRIAGDEARVVVAVSENTANESFEIDLRRNVVFRRDDVFGRCDGLKYVSAKNLAILSGDGSNKAALYRQAYSGAPRETLGEFSRALYHLETKRLEVESISASGVDD
jgi:hypothetical protein